MLSVPCSILQNLLYSAPVFVSAGLQSAPPTELADMFHKTKHLEL
jgi:hypothetical protein